MNGSIPTQADHLAYTAMDDRVVIIDPGQSLLYWLNPVASRIWELSDGTSTAAQIATRILDEHDVDLATARRDTDAMLDAFAQKGLLTVEPTG